jgi:hypothetical protein
MSAGVSTMDMSRPGECVDLFYYDGETSKKQCYPTTQNTKYVQSFQNTGAGTSVFTLSPNSGIQDVILSFVVGQQAAGSGLVLPRGWGYAAIKQVSFRYGGSSQFFISGDQVLQNALRCQPNRSAVNDILTLGGNLSNPADLAAGDVSAAVVLKLPHSWPSGVGKSHPFPSDCITQAIQITVELNNPQSIFSTTSSGIAPPLNFKTANFQVQQCVLNNAGDSLARRVDLSVNAYAFPCEFVQNVQRIPLSSVGTTASQSVTLTGFRAGEVTKIICWLTRTSDTPVFTGTLGQLQNPFIWYLPKSVQLSYSGDVYARYENATSPLWNLINGNKAPAVDNLDITATALSASSTTTPYLSQWVELPFAQTLVDEDSHYTLVHGKMITNGLCNLDITAPDNSADYVLNVSYVYNSTLLISQGTCDYIF